MKLASKFLVVILLIFLPLCSSICIDMYLPAYAQIANSFHVSEGLLDVSMSMYLFGLAIGQLFYGTISDALGRKRTL